MKALIFLAVWCMVLVVDAAPNDQSLEPAGFGPFETEKSAERNQVVAKLLRLQEDVEGFRFAVVCLTDDEHAYAAVVREDPEGTWIAVVREGTLSRTQGLPKEAREHTVVLDPKRARVMADKIVASLKSVRYSDDRGPGAFTTGGTEVFVAARPQRVFMAGRTWDPLPGSTAHEIQQIALELCHK